MKSVYPMKKVVFFLIVLGLIQIAPAEGRPLDSGERTPQRIVSLTLGTDEILLSLVDPKRIVAVTHFAIDPKISHVAEAAKAIPNKIRADTERVVALEPDLVLVASYTSPDVVKQLIDAGLPLVKLELFSSIPQIQQNILAVGRAVGEEKGAQEMIADMNRRFQKLAERISLLKRRPGVLSYSPTGSTAGSKTTFDEMVTLAGGRNLAAETGLSGHGSLSLETLMMLDPEIIILSAWDPQAPGFDQMFLNHPALKSLSAIRMKRLYSIPEKYLTTVSQYIADAVEEVARLIHPELFLEEASHPLESGAGARR